MSETEKKKPTELTPAGVLKGESPLVLTATLEPIAGDRFQPAGFPEIGHVIYKAPRKDGSTENVCIVDSTASMANHLEFVCLRGAHDPDLVDDLAGMPYLRCVTGDLQDDKLPSNRREVVATSLTEGHRIASSYFLEGAMLNGDGSRMVSTDAPTTRSRGKSGANASSTTLESELINRFGIVLPGGSKAHPPPAKWWNVFKTIFEIDPNALVHGVLFPQWQIKIPRALTAHLEALGAGRVDRSGVKFDRLGKTTSGQPIFAVDDATAESIRATFVLDLGLVRSFGRKKKDGGAETQLGLSDKQKEFLVALALWKIHKLLESPFRFRSGCHLRRTTLKKGDEDVRLEVDIVNAIKDAGFRSEGIAADKRQPPVVTDVYWPRDELYREGQAESAEPESEEDEGSEGETS